jgi:hypothetical protein
LRNISAAAWPAAPAPTISTLDGDLAGVGTSRFSRSPRISCSPRRSTAQHGNADSAGAAVASPLRTSKRAWCHGQRTSQPSTRPSISGAL